MSPPANLAVWLVVLPLLAGLFCFVLPKRAGQAGPAAGLLILGTAVGTTRELLRAGPFRYEIGGWAAPLGINLQGDGLSVCLLLLTAGLGLLLTLYATGYFRGPGPGNQARRQEDRAAGFFWPLWFFLWAALNGLFLAGDLFNIYICLELLGLSAVSLASLTKGNRAAGASLRYFLLNLAASFCYLLGVVLLYRLHTTLDLTKLCQLSQQSPLAAAALSLITLALVVKSALFPLHVWLPPAHASAPAPVSALLSGLVVKASFYLLLRFWLEVFGPAPPGPLALLLGILGGAAIIWGSIQALLTDRLKMLVAYSTVAQVGYLFLLFPLCQPPVRSLVRGGVVYLLLSHATAKAALFFAAGNFKRLRGEDRLAGLTGMFTSLPLTSFGMTLAGVSLMGLPPSGGFIAKWQLLTAALTKGMWGWAVLIVLGGLLTAAYLLRIVGPAFSQGAVSLLPRRRVEPVMEWTTLALALAAILLGLLPWRVLPLLEIGFAGLASGPAGVAP